MNIYKINKKVTDWKQLILKTEWDFVYTYSIEAGITEPVPTAPEEPETVKVGNKHAQSDINAQMLLLAFLIKWDFSIFVRRLHHIMESTGPMKITWCVKAVTLHCLLLIHWGADHIIRNIHKPHLCWIHLSVSLQLGFKLKCGTNWISLFLLYIIWFGQSIHLNCAFCYISSGTTQIAPSLILGTGSCFVFLSA